MNALPPTTAKLVRSVAALVCEEDAAAFRLMRLRDAISHAETRCIFLLSSHGNSSKVPSCLVELAVHEAVLEHLTAKLVAEIG